MTQRQIVILPNGQEIDAPIGVSKEEIKDKAIRNGLISADAFKTQEPTPTVEQEDLPFYKDIYNYVKSNMDLPLGLAGALKGQQLGAPLGPAGRIVGGIGLGAFGTFGGSLASDVITDKEELD